jgi:Predicted glycosyltransferases
MVYIVIPVFNRWAYTQACLHSLSAQTYQGFTVVVIDHGSTDGTSDRIAQEFPEVILLKGDDSMWWTAATNAGIRYVLKRSDAKFILTLNNDTIAEPDFLFHLMESTAHAPENSLIGSSAIDAESKEYIYRGERLKWAKESTLFLNEITESRPDNGLLKVSHFPGRGLLIPLEVFQTIGLFDEKHFPHYMADYDFTLRAAKKGFGIFCSWDAKLGIYPEASGANQLKRRKTLGGYIQHLFGIKGGGNLPLFYQYALRHCPIWALPSHLVLGSVRRLLGYWI